MSYQYFDAQGNNYVRPWNNDFTDAEKQELGIGEYRDPATYEMPTAEQEQHNSWPGSAEEILQRMQDAERVKQSGERFPFEVPPQGPARFPRDGRTPNSWDPSRRFEDAGGINPLGPRSERIEVIPYSEEETNARKWGLLNSFVDMIKRTGGKLMDRYQQNKEDRRKWQEENPGGYPSMPQHLRERLRRNQMSSIDGQLVAGYDPELDQYMYDEHGPVVGTPSQEFLDRPKIFGSDVLDMLIENEQVKNPSRSNNGWA